MNLGELFASRENLASVLDSLTDAIIAHDNQRRITVFNTAAERLTGLNREEVLGRDCHDILEGGFCGSRCAFCTNCVPTFDLETFPMVVNDTEGQQHQVETTVVPVKNPDGGVVGIVAAAKDVTEVEELRRTLRKQQRFWDIIGKHHRMQAVYELIRQVGPTDVPVLVQGASGTGKELVARAIHAESEQRSKKPFVAVNCGALPEGLLESELFGHVKGAFTGAVRDKKGRFQMADGGTLFLDEVGELSQATQVKLLRVLQEKRFDRVGDEHPISVDVRIISATNRDLRDMVRRGEFREDLFFRLCVVPVELPPLKDRGQDVFLLADHFLNIFAKEMGRNTPRLSPETTRVMLDYDWPGNVRELINALQFALVKNSSGVIEPEHLPQEVTSAQPRRKRSKAGRKKKLSEEQVLEALEQAQGNRVEAAKILGVGRSTLYRYLDTTKD